MLEVWLADVGIAVRNGTLGTFTLELLLVQCNDVRPHVKELGTCLSDVISIKIRLARDDRIGICCSSYFWCRASLPTSCCFNLEFNTD